MIEAGFTTVQSLAAAINKDVRDAINAGAIPVPRLLTSIHQITEKSGAPAKLREMVRQTKAEGGDVTSIRDGGMQLREGPYSGTRLALERGLTSDHGKWKC